MAGTNDGNPLDALLQSLLDSPGELFTVLHNAWRDDLKEKTGVAGSALARLQNEGHASSFKLAHDALPKFSNAFDVMHILEQTVPHLDKINIIDLFEFEKSVYETTKNDLAGGILRNKIIKRFESHPDEARETIKRHLEEPTDETGPIFIAALIGLSAENFQEAVNVAIDSAESSTFSISASAIAALGHINFLEQEQPVELERVFKTIENHAYNPVSKLLYVSAMALQCIVANNHCHHQKLMQLLDSNTKEGAHAVVEFLWRNQEEFKNNELYYNLLNLCTKVQVEDKNTIEHLDFVLGDCLKDGRSKINIKFWLRDWVTKQTGNNTEIDISEAFDSLFMELLRQPEILGDIFTEWLIHDDLRLPAAIHKMSYAMAVHNFLTISFSPHLISAMDKDDLILLTRRTIGWIFNATIRINLLWSLTKADDAAKNTYGIVLSVFSDILGYEYPLDVKTLINAIRSDENDNELNSLCDEILRAIDTYAANLNRLAPVKEFHSLHEKYRILRKAREKEMSKAQEKANENSIILQLVSRVAVKAGTGSFSRLPDGRGYSARLPFTSYETSITLPRSIVTNTVGSELELILYRNSKRGD